VIARVAAASLFWIAVGLIQKLDWGSGGPKALVLLALFAATPVVAAAAGPTRASEPRRASPRALVLATTALLLLQGGYAMKELRHPALIDAATTTLAAGSVLRAGDNPYAAPLDSAAEGTMRQPRFAGYKYLPVTLAAYLPLGAPLGERGIVLTNLLLDLAAVALIFGLAAELAGTPAAGWLAALLYLSLPLIPFQLFAKGVTDLAAVVPLLAALLLIERSALWCGLCIGLSLAAKPVPGVLLLPCCLPASPRARALYGAGVALGVLPAIAFLLWSPTPFLDNIVLFNLARPADSTSWLFDAPAVAGTIARALALSCYVAAFAFIWRQRPGLAVRIGGAIMLALAAILAGPAAHHNYQLWWLPLAAALLGAALAAKRLPSAAAAL
jgi:hypothetical protein